jgi:hypothetical protein
MITVSGNGSVGALNSTNTAIRYSGNSIVDVTNSGGVYGDVLLARTGSASTVGTFTNTSVGLFNPITRVEAEVNDSGTTLIGTDSAASTVTFTGTYTQKPFAQLSLDIFTSTQYDSIAFSGSHGVFEGTLLVFLQSSFVPQQSQTFNLIQSAASNNFSPSFLNSISVIGLDDGYIATTFVADHALNLQITVVPEPALYGSVGLLLLGLAAWKCHRRAKTS